MKIQERIRLKHLYDSICCVCAKNKKRSITQNDQNPIIQFYNMTIIKDPQAKEDYYQHHIICSSCCDFMSKQFKSELGEKTILQILDGAHKSLSLVLDCKLCGVEHSIFIKPNNNKPVVANKNNDKACCGGCNIY